MIVAVTDRHVEGDSTKELLEVGSDVILRPAHVEELREFQVTRSLALIFSQKCHCGSIKTPAGTRTVEALNAEGVVLAVEATKLRGRHLDTRSGCQLLS